MDPSVFQTSSSSVSSTHSSSFTGNKNHTASSTTTTSTSTQNGSASNGKATLNFHLARVGLDDALQTEASGPNYKSIKVSLELTVPKHQYEFEATSEPGLLTNLPNSKSKVS